MPPQTITPLGLILHEWATNSAKHGALSRADGAVTVSAILEDGVIRLHWRELGGPEVVRDGIKDGFGTRLVALSARQLGGNVRLEWLTKGLSAMLSFPAVGS